MPGGMKRILNGPQLHRHHRGMFNPALLFILQTVDPLLQCSYLGLESSLVVFHLFHDFILRHRRLPSPSSPSPVPTRTTMTFAVAMSPMAVTKASHHITSDAISLSISVPIYLLPLDSAFENQTKQLEISGNPAPVQQRSGAPESRIEITNCSERPT
jgi:hypothetical protein